MLFSLISSIQLCRAYQTSWNTSFIFQMCKLRWKYEWFLLSLLSTRKTEHPDILHWRTKTRRAGRWSFTSNIHPSTGQWSIATGSGLKFIPRPQEVHSQASRSVSRSLCNVWVTYSLNKNTGMFSKSSRIVSSLIKIKFFCW